RGECLPARRRWLASANCHAPRSGRRDENDSPSGLSVATLGRIARQLRANVRIRIAPDITTGDVVYGPALDQRSPAKGIGIVRGWRRRTVQTVGAILRARL